MKDIDEPFTDGQVLRLIDDKIKRLGFMVTDIVNKMLANNSVMTERKARRIEKKVAFTIMRQYEKAGKL